MFDRSSLSGFDRIGSPPSWTDIKAFASTVFWSSAVVVVVATWVAFWTLVMRLQLLQREFLSAAVVGLLFVAPAIVGLSAYLDPLPDPVRLVPT